MDVSQLNPEIKKQVLEYVILQKPACLSETGNYQSSCFRKFSTWVGAYSSISEIEPTQKYSFILSQIITVSDPNTAANIFLAYNPREFHSASPALLNQFKNKLSPAGSYGANQNPRSAIQGALGNIAGLLK